MAFITDTVAIQRFAIGLFNVRVGSVTMAQVDKQIANSSFGATLNSVYDANFGGMTTSAVAKLLVANLGITGTGVAGAEAYVVGALNAAPTARGEAVNKILSLFSGLTNDATYGAAAQAFNANLDAAAAYSGAANVAVGTSIEQYLTSSQDVLYGTASADLFTADLSAGANTLQGGDRIDGGAGNDTLKATLGSVGGNFSIAATTTSVEKIIVQAQSRANDSGDNNIAGTAVVNVDAGRMSGVTTWENNNSRADLIVEDVRIADNQITKDVTITMRETDPGNVDYAVYFDQNSLRNASASTSQINLQVMDTKAVVDGNAPLLNSPYGGFKFTSTDSKGVATVVTLQSAAIDAAQTYAELAAAFQVEADKQFGAGTVTVSVGNNFSVTDTTTAKLVVGQEIVLKTNASYTFTTPAATSGWVAAGVVPANSGLHTNFSQGTTTSTDPVTSTIVLDDVGRGATGGDLVVGALSTGLTADSKGVQRFNITVEDNSTLQHIDSTNNSLKEVAIVNGTTTRQTDAYTTTVKDAGNLTVKGDAVINGINQAGVPLSGTPANGNLYGFNDVRLIDAATFKGKLDLTAALSSSVVAKYMTLTDASPAAPAADNVTFAYNLGTNNDTFSLVISAANLAAAGTTAREDFVLSISGGAGNDTITTSIDNGNAVEIGVDAWYNNSKLNANLSIDGGDGNDTISTKGAGDWKITAGAGNDTVYSDNSGGKAVWVFNTADQTAVPNPAARVLTDLVSSSNSSYNLYKGTAEVTFRGLTSKVTIDSTGYKTSDLQINQAIKLAINSDAVLSKLLKATDGPANTLVVTSLIDGGRVDGDLAVAVTKPAAGVLTTAELAAAAAAYNLPVGSNEVAVLNGMDDQTMDAAGGDYSAKLANGNANAGTDSNAATDSIHNLGAGDDVLVLSTNNSVDGGDVNKSTVSNEKVVYDAASFGNDTIVNFGASTVGTKAQVVYTFAQGPDAVAAATDPDLAAAGFTAVNNNGTVTFTQITASTIAGANAQTALQLAAFGGQLPAGGVFSSNAAGVAAVVGDMLDFTAFGGKSAGFNAALNTDGGINVVATVAASNTVAAVKGLFADDATANKGIYVAYDAATNVGTVYQIVDGTAASDLTVTLLGTIDLADTAWNTLIAANFA